MIVRATDAAFMNEVLNHPHVYPWVKGAKTGPLDISEVIARKEHVVLVGEYGGVIFIKLDIGLYEAHTAVLPKHRGQWTIQLGRDALDYMFCRTDAVEIVTKCPHGNLAASAGARAIRAVCDFTTRPMWPLGSRIVPIDVYAVRIQDWIKRADQMIAEGQHVHEWLVAHGIPVDHGDDETHDRYVGATWEMIRHGFIAKGLHFYYRWAVMSGYRPILLIGENPVRLDIGSAILRLDGGQWEVVRPQPMSAA